MIVHKCDVCKTEMSAWLNVEVSIGAMADYINIADLIPLRGKKECCKRCFARIIEDGVNREES
jgi:hypothetical protein